jgi:hypothetical protein
MKNATNRLPIIETGIVVDGCWALPVEFLVAVDDTVLVVFDDIVVDTVVDELVLLTVVVELLAAATVVFMLIPVGIVIASDVYVLCALTPLSNTQVMKKTIIPK